MMRWPSRPRLHARVVRVPLLACPGFPRPMALGHQWGSPPMDPHPATRFAPYPALHPLNVHVVLNVLEDIPVLLASHWCPDRNIAAAPAHTLDSCSYENLSLLAVSMSTFAVSSQPRLLSLSPA